MVALLVQESARHPIGRGHALPSANPLGCDSTTDAPAHLDTRNIAHAIRIHPRVVVGSKPEGLAGFRELKQLGVKTIISVDGLLPDTQSARSLGLRYVHMPQGYDGIPPTEINQLAKAIHDLPAPIFVHCHHGRHRAPAAAVAACIALGYLEKNAGEPTLTFAGTSRDYTGLYGSVLSTRRLTPRAIAAIEADFREAVAPPRVVEVMTELEALTDRLAGHLTHTKDTDSRTRPANDALMLAELFAELRRTPETQRRSPAFATRLAESESSARKLHRSLNQQARDKLQAVETLRHIRANCVACHRAFRD